MYALAGGGKGVGDPALTLYGHATDSSLRFDVAEGATASAAASPPRNAAIRTPFWAMSTVKARRRANAAPGFDGPSGDRHTEGSRAVRTACCQRPSSRRGAH